MRRFLLAIPTSLLLVSAYAGAQSRDYPLTDEMSVSTVHVRADRPIFATLLDADSVTGVYAMSNGWSLKVEQMRKGILAQIDDEHPIHLIRLPGDKYRTPDGNVEMHFRLGAYGDDMTMSYVPRSDATAMITISTDSRLASR